VDEWDRLLSGCGVKSSTQGSNPCLPACFPAQSGEPCEGFPWNLRKAFHNRALVAQWIERLPAEEKVARSNRVEGARLADGVRLYLNGIEERSTKPKVESSSLSGRTLLEVEFAADMVMAERRRVATLVDWLFAPEWLTLQQACELSGRDPESLQEIVDEGGVDLNNAGLIHKQSLYEFQEALAEVLHWYD
jgi:hypothetical protein